MELLGFFYFETHTTKISVKRFDQYLMHPSAAIDRGKILIWLKDGEKIVRDNLKTIGRNN